MAKQNENPIVYGDGAQGSDADGGTLGKMELPLFLSSKSLARAFNSGDANELSMLDESSDVHPEDIDNSVGNDDNDDNDVMMSHSLRRRSLSSSETLMILSIH